MTSGFADRFAQAHPWELELIELLQNRGWLAAPFGQAQIPEPIRAHLARWRDQYGRETLLRWTPDIIAARPDANPFVCLIDAKTESENQRSSDNYAIEVNAVRAGQTIVRDWNIPLFYAWPDGGVMTPDLVENRFNRRMDGAAARGSGTAFYLVAKKFARPCDAVFPQVHRPSRAA